MKSRHPFETVILACVAAALVFGVASALVDVTWFDTVYAAEDGPIEWATAAALLASAVVSVWTLFRPAAARGRLHAATWIGLALLCLFAAGEEISWGQRIFDFSSPAFFLQHNAQRETNLHNLVVAGVKVNKVVFSQLMIVCAALFLLVLPVLHRRSAALARVVDALAVPVPRLLHVVAVLGTFAIMGLVRSRRRDELLELGATAIFLLILLFPGNVAAIRRVRPGREAADAAALGAQPPVTATRGASSEIRRNPGSS